jgi:hypothetical protein
VTGVPPLRARGLGRPALVLLLALALVGAGFASASCGLDLSDLSNGGDALPDGATAATDGPSNEAGVQGDTGGGDAAAADSAAGPRKNSCGGLLFGTPLPLFNPDFELGCTNGWSVYAGGATEDTALPSSGAIACRVCTGSTGPDGFFISAALGRPVLPGEVYELVACVRAVPTGGGGGVSPYAELNAGTEGHRDSTVALGPTYTTVRASFTPTAAHPDLSMDIRVSPGVAGDCFLVDDVSVARVRDATTN